MSSDNVRARLASATQRMPGWLRHDLGSSDAALRQRAEGSLLAMLAVVEEAGEDVPEIDDAWASCVWTSVQDQGVVPVWTRTLTIS